MGQETGGKRAKRRPKGAANSIRYRLLELERFVDLVGAVVIEDLEGESIDPVNGDGRILESLEAKRAAVRDVESFGDAESPALAAGSISHLDGELAGAALGLGTAQHDEP